MENLEETTQIDCLGGTDKPQIGRSYRAKNGRYYNGFMMSPDAGEYFFGDVWRAIAKDIEADLLIKKPEGLK